jgi:hypothetical protein
MATRKVTTSNNHAARITTQATLRQQAQEIIQRAAELCFADDVRDLPESSTFFGDLKSISQISEWLVSAMTPRTEDLRLAVADLKYFLSCMEKRLATPLGQSIFAAV